MTCTCLFAVPLTALPSIAAPLAGFVLLRLRTEGVVATSIVSSVGPGDESTASESSSLAVAIPDFRD